MEPVIAVPADSSVGLSCPVKSRPAQSEQEHSRAGMNNNAGWDQRQSVSGTPHHSSRVSPALSQNKRWTGGVGEGGPLKIFLQ